jgi:large subunit ribosomal protein L6
MYELPEGVAANVEQSTRITLEGVDKELVGQTAATIRAFRPPEPYKGKGIRYENEVIRTKVGKAGVA